MSEMIITKKIIVNDVEKMMKCLRTRASVDIKSEDVVKNFILNQKNTVFYFDREMKMSDTPTYTTDFLWVDTGLKTKNGDTIFISLKKQYDGEFVGHYIGTAQELSEMPLSKARNRRNANSNFSSFKSTYNNRVSNRAITHIESESSYFLAKCNGNSLDMIQCDSEMARLIKSLNTTFEDNLSEENNIIAEEEIVATEEVVSETEREITMELALELVEERDALIEELLAKIDELSSKYANAHDEVEVYKVKYREMQKANVLAREFCKEEEAIKAERDAEKEVGEGHALLGPHKQVLVIGSELNRNTMEAIMKNNGFEKNDFEFWEYNEYKSKAASIRRDGKYRAVIWGCGPHSVKNKGEFNSGLDKTKTLLGENAVVTACTASKTKKVTKTSFTQAVQAVCNYLGAA